MSDDACKGFSLSSSDKADNVRMYVGTYWLMSRPHPEGKGSDHFRHISWDSLKLIAFRFEK